MVETIPKWVVYDIVLPCFTHMITICSLHFRSPDLPPALSPRQAERKGGGWGTFSSLLVAFVVMMIRIRASLTIRRWISAGGCMVDFAKVGWKNDG